MATRARGHREVLRPGDELVIRSHADLPRSQLRLAQVLATAWLVTGQSIVWPHGVLAVISTALCLGVLVTRFTRTCCLGLAALIGVELVLTPTWFAHNRLFVGALLLMVSLSSRRFAILPRWQAGLVFLLAGLDKLFEPAWRDGRFFESFIAQLARFGLMWSPGGRVGDPNVVASWLEQAGSRPVWMLVGLGAIAIELFLGACFLFNVRFGAWLNVAFHVIVFAVTGSTMGQFFFAGVACSFLLIKGEEVPGPWLAVLTTVALAGPWTHRFLPIVFLVGWALWRRRYC